MSGGAGEGRTGLEIAVVGMAGRFPGAPDVDTLWRNLAEGREALAPLSEDELREAGVPEALWRCPEYVRARGGVDDEDRFDASFFGFSPREAAIIDPQHRLFLESAWAALEDAAIDPARFPGPIGLYAGVSFSTYQLQVMGRPDVVAAVGPLQVMIGNDKDHLATRAAYRLDLRGPAVVVQSACSTSLLAVHTACRALLAGECDAALAGGASVNVPQRVGYLHQEGGILSPDGHCRAFDADAAGTVPGSGVGVVVLRRLADALADGDPVRAVIRGSAANNDGARKVGYTAPSVEGQARVIADALAVAAVSPDTVTYVEAHGTGTRLGDPVEVAALTRAFRTGTGRTGFCGLGSVKSNLGHLDAAAGVTGLIKTVLALEAGQLPPTLHARRPNPALELASSPFYVVDRLRWWDAGGGPRRAGVSSFGLGGTNVHVVLEEAPARPPSARSRRPQVFPLSARTPAALGRLATRLAEHLRAHPALSPGDVAATLQRGRQAFAHRRAVVAASAAGAAAALESGAGATATAIIGRPVAFLFPGQGTQFPGMARGPYDAEPVFREEVDRCCALLRPRVDADLRALLVDGARDGEALSPTALAQPALFVVEYALARLWMSWGVTPAAMLGHSIGEYVAACLAGVFALEDALRLVAERGRLMQAQPPGAMLAVPLPEGEVRPRLGGGVSLAAVNGPAASVVAGPEGEVAALERRWTAEGVATRRLHTSHAFHSAMMEPALLPFRRAVEGVRRSVPTRPFVSNLTGRWITPAEATSADYWTAHLRQAVRFSDGLAALLDTPDVVLLEVGPGRALSTLARGSHPGAPAPPSVPSLPAARDAADGHGVLLDAVARLWTIGVEVDFDRVADGEERQRIRLPSYPFERERHWIDPAPRAADTPLPPASAPAPAPDGGAEPARPEFLGPYVEPVTELERTIAAVWHEVLGGPPVGRDDAFLEVGGQSLLGLQVTTLLSRALGVAVPADALFRAATVAELARLVEALPGPRAGDPAPESPATDTDGARERTALSFPEERLVRQHLANPAAAANESFLLGLSGALDVDALGRALGEIVRRHEAFRTTYVVDGERLRASVVRPADLRIAVTDLGSLPPGEREAEARRELRDDAARPFDLSAAPLLRARLVRLDADEHVLGLALHPVTGDGWGMGVFFRELEVLYGAFVRGAAPPLPEPRARYDDFARMQRERAADPRAEQGVRERAALLPRLRRPFPTTSPGATGVRCDRSLSAAEAGALRERARRAGATPFMVLLQALVPVLARRTGHDDLVVAVPSAHRHDERFHDVVGFFANLVLLPVGELGDAGAAAVLARVRDVVTEAFAREVPYERLRASLGCGPGDLPFHAVLVMQGDGETAGAGGPALPGLLVRALGSALDLPRFPLALYVTAAGGGLHLTLRATGGWSAADAEAALDEVLARLRAPADAVPGEHLPSPAGGDRPRSAPPQETSDAALP